MNFLQKDTIKARVMKAVNAKLAEAEKEYQLGCEEIDRKAETEKTTLADKHVEAIIGKFI